jgi:hypothetical protein
MTSERCDRDVWTGTFGESFVVESRQVHSAMCGGSIRSYINIFPKIFIFYFNRKFYKKENHFRMYKSIVPLPLSEVVRTELYQGLWLIQL